MMPDDGAASVYALVSLLCESLAQEYSDNKSKIETSARRLKSKAFEILLKKSRKRSDFAEDATDPLRQLNVKRFQYCIEASSNPEQRLPCAKFNECLNFIEDESYFGTDAAKSILAFLVAVSGAIRPVVDDLSVEINLLLKLMNIEQLKPGQLRHVVWDNNSFNFEFTLRILIQTIVCDGHKIIQDKHLLIPGPFTLHANYNAVAHYPSAINNNPHLETTFKSFQLLKNYRNVLHEPNFRFVDDLKSLSKAESTFSLKTASQQQKPSCGTLETYQETWKCGLNINSSLCRFFNSKNHSVPSVVRSEGTKKSQSTLSKNATSASNIVAIPNPSRLTLNWSWESMGQVAQMDPNFITETDSALHLHAARANAIGYEFEAKIVHIDRFLMDVKNLTIGIQSDSFRYDSALIFHMEPNITVSDISPAVMETYISTFTECGSCYKRLQLLTAKKNLPFLFDGFIFKATCSAIEEYLMKFRQFVVLFEDQTLLGFQIRMKKMTKQISYLAHVFAVHPNVDLDVRPPMGSQFLGYLYKEITNTTQKDIIMLLVYILKQCCFAYFKYIQKWIFHGELDDPRNELFICFVDHYRANTKYFYDKAYFVRKESVPGFLQGFEDKILQCGKYTSLLKTFNPTHPIFSVDCPSISVCLSFQDIKKVQESCQDYMKKAREICGKAVSVGDIFEERRVARRNFKEMVQEKSLLNLEKWAFDYESQAAEETARKRKRLEELQNHLKAVRERKLADKKNDLALELKILKEAQEIEDKRIAQENVNVQKRIEYYQQLNAIMEERRARAEIAKASSTTVKMEADPGTPVSTNTDFESCFGEDEQIDEDAKSVYEDASTSVDFLEKFLETEKKLNEYIERGNNNRDNREIQRSTSDVLNSNEVVMSDYQSNKAKVLGSCLSSVLGEKAPPKTESDVPTARLTEAQKNKLKVLSSEFGIDVNSNETADVPSTSRATAITRALSDLELNRNKMMHNDPFVNFNAGMDRKKLELDLETDLARNRRRVLDSEYNILTGVASNKSTPMSTTSDSPMVDDHEEDVKNANALKLIVPSRPIGKWDSVGTPDMDMTTTNTFEETPECGLSTAGVTARKGFYFGSGKEKSTRVPSVIDLQFKGLPSCDEEDLPTSSELQVCGEFNPQFKWQLVSEVLSLNRVKSSRNIDYAEGMKVNDLNVITLTEFLQKSVIVPLSAHLEVMNSEIMRTYLTNLDILGHFKSLRNYFFLMDGEFGSIVCDGLISKLENGAHPNELLSYRMLHTILDNALSSSNSGNDKNAENLSFIVTELPEKFDLSTPDALSSLSLSYRVTWPVNLILNPETLAKYASIFKYLIKVRRISWILEESYQKLKEIVKKNRKEMLRSPQYRRVQQIRHKLFHFIHALSNHITSSAMQASWKTFKDDLVAAKSIEDIYRKHTTYIKRVLFLCMMNKKSVEFYNAIENIFKVTIRFSRNLKSREWKRRGGDEAYTHSRYERMLADEAEFEKVIKYTIYLGNKIVRHGYQEEIGEFINLINFNQYYLVET